MNENINETVTLSLKNYEEMKAEIKSLRYQVQEKTESSNAIKPMLTSVFCLA